jgi:hypothetical protein
MRAEISQIPAATESKPQSEPPLAKAKPNDGVYATIRRLERRISHLEETASTLRRDVNRIDKANSRAKNEQPSSVSPTQLVPELQELLFGGKV